MSKQSSKQTLQTEVSLDHLVEFGPVVEVPTTTTKSDRIRLLASQGMKRGDIAKQLGIRYQHVRNVLITPLKRNGQL